MQRYYRFYFSKSINTGLEDGPQLALLKILILFFPGYDFFLEGDDGILIDNINFEGAGAEVVELFAADFDDVE